MTAKMMTQLEGSLMNLEKKLGHNTGLTYMFLQAICFSLNGLIIKYLPGVPSFQIVFYRSLLQIIINMPIGAYYEINYYPENDNTLKLLCMRGFFGCLGFSLYFYAVKIIPLAEAQTLMFTSPIWTGILGYFFLREKYTKVEMLSAIFGLIGIIMIIKPDFIMNWIGLNYTQGNDIYDENSNLQFNNNNIRQQQSQQDNGQISYNNEQILYSKELNSNRYNQQSIGRIAAICGSFFQAIIFIVIRSLKDSSTAFITNFYFNFFSVLMAPIAMMYQGSIFLDLNQFSLIFLMAILSYIGQLMMTRGLTLEKPAKGSVINYIQIVLSLFYSYFLLKEPIDFMSILGSISIMCIAVLLFYNNWIAKKE